MNDKVSLSLKGIILLVLPSIVLGMCAGTYVRETEQTMIDLDREFDIVLHQYGECESELDATRWDLKDARQTKDWTAAVTAEQFGQAVDGSFECSLEPTCQYRHELDDFMLIIAHMGWEQASDGWGDAQAALEWCERQAGGY